VHSPRLSWLGADLWWTHWRRWSYPRCIQC